MNSFKQFEDLLFEKLCSIECRLSKIEAALGIEQEISQEQAEKIIPEPEIASPDNEPLKNEIVDLQEKLLDIKALFSESEI